MRRGSKGSVSHAVSHFAFSTVISSEVETADNNTDNSHYHIKIII